MTGLEGAIDFGLDFNVDLPEESDDKFRVINPKDYVAAWEEEVKRYMMIGGNLPTNTIKYEHVQIPKDLNPQGFQRWALTEIERCKNGHNGMSGKMYFYFNYCWIQQVGKKIRPNFRVIDNEWFKFVEACQKSNEWGIICVKRRRVGASWKEASDVLHDCIFNTHFKVGMNSKGERDSIELFKKVKFQYENLPSFLRIPTAAGNTKTYLDFSYYPKGNKGETREKIKKGNESTILAVSPTDNAYEGLMLSKWVCDESGKIKNLATLWQYTEDCLMAETRRVGIPILFGTAGDITSEGKDFEYMWRNAAQYKLKKFFFSGWMGLTSDEYGNDDKENGIRWIVYERHRREGLRVEELNTFIQKYPLTVPEAFTTTTDAGVGNIIKIAAQQHSLRENPPYRKTGWFKMLSGNAISFVPDPRGKCTIYEEPKPGIDSLYIGGCLPPGEQVLTDSGLKNIETITYNDKLISKDGEYVKIKELQQYYVEDNLYTVKVGNTVRTTKFTGEHPLYVSKNVKGFTSFDKKKRLGLKYSHQKFDFNFTKMSDVEVGDWIKYPNIYRTIKKVDFENIWSKLPVRKDFVIDNPMYSNDFWWLVGLWLGDGSFSDTGICISCNSKETRTIEKLSNIIKTQFKRSPTLSKKKSNCIDVEFNSKQLKQFLFNTFGKGVSEKRIPEWVKYIQHEYKLSLFAGMLDSDGCVTQDKRKNLYYIEIVGINQLLLESIQDILFSLGIVSSTGKLREAKDCEIMGRKTRQQKAYRVRIGHYFVKQLVEHNCPSIKLSILPKQLLTTRSQNMGCYIDSNQEYIYFQIKDIQSEKFKGIVHNFHCETSTYLCRHIATHNCDPADHNDTFGEVSDLSMYIMKRQHGTDSPRIVFEYTDRPADVTEYYEQAMYACLYYNSCKLLIERNRIGMINDWEKSNFKFLLARTPSGIERVLNNGRTNTLGVTMTPAKKKFLKELVAKYIEDYCEFIPSLDLLGEFAYYGAKNTDKVMAFGIALMMLEEYKHPITNSTTAIAKLPHFGFKNINGKIQRVQYKLKEEQQYQ